MDETLPRDLLIIEHGAERAIRRVQDVDLRHAAWVVACGKGCGRRSTHIMAGACVTLRHQQHHTITGHLAGNRGGHSDGDGEWGGRRDDDDDGCW
jgi:hypothetical protein